MFWGLLGVGLALGGTGVPLIAEPGTGFWGIVGWVLLAAGILCLMAAAVVLAKRRALAASGISAQAIVSEASSVTGSVVGNVIQDSTVNVTSGAAPGESAERRKDVVLITPEKLCALYEGRTSLEGDRLAAPYLGKPMRVSGPLDDVRNNPHGFPYRQVTIEYEPSDPDARVPHISMFFPGEAEEQLAVIPRGTPITVVGRIAGVSLGSLRLDDCELEDG